MGSVGLFWKVAYSYVEQNLFEFVWMIGIRVYCLLLSLLNGLSLHFSFLFKKKTWPTGNNVSLFLFEAWTSYGLRSLGEYVNSLALKAFTEMCSLRQLCTACALPCTTVYVGLCAH